MSNSINRRKFLKQGGTAALGLVFLPGWATKVAASDRVRIAIVGVGGMGNNHLKMVLPVCHGGRDCGFV